jgi:hypothetical protein
MKKTLLSPPQVLATIVHRDAVMPPSGLGSILSCPPFDPANAPSCQTSTFPPFIILHSAFCILHSPSAIPHSPASLLPFHSARLPLYCPLVVCHG